MQNPAGPVDLSRGTGTARIVGVAVVGVESVVTLERPTTDRVELTLAVTPDERAASASLAAEETPLAVLVVGHAARYECSVLVRSSRGPGRVDISLEHALALCRAGVHGVFRWDRSDSGSR